RQRESRRGEAAVALDRFGQEPLATFGVQLRRERSGAEESSCRLARGRIERRPRGQKRRSPERVLRALREVDERVERGRSVRAVAIGLEHRLPRVLRLLRTVDALEQRGRGSE